MPGFPILWGFFKLKRSCVFIASERVDYHLGKSLFLYLSFSALPLKALSMIFAKKAPSLFIEFIDLS